MNAYINTDFMKLAIKEAKKAGNMGEVPIGALLVSETGNILGAGCNKTVSLKDPSAHAEMLAMRMGAKKINNYRLINTTLYITLEPCIMCMGAVIHARIARLVFGASDPKWGAAGSLYNFANDIRLNHQVEIISGILEDECKAIIQNFFKTRRKPVASK